jgi:hypothetical protein
MKRLFCTFLALVLTLSCVLVLGSCNSDGDGKKDAEPPKPATAPEGYTTYDNGDISFAYPSDWTKNDGSTTMLVNKSGKGNNITVVYEAKNDIYEKSSDSELEKAFKDSMSAMGMTISNFKRTKTKNDYNDVTKITFTTSAAGTSMKQTQLVATVGDRTYVVTVTETTADQTLVDNVFNTFVVLK